MPFVAGSKDRNPASRAEVARQRRTQRSQTRVNSASNRVVKPVKNRPVTVRGGAFGSPILQQVGKKRSRRQFYVTMDQYGAELRLPALPVLNPGWRLLSGLLAILALAGIITMWNLPFFQIMSVDVTGLQRINSDELVNDLRLENLSIIEIDPKAVEQEIARAYPELVDIQVQLEMPAFISISAAERQPVLAWHKGDQVSWVDTEGVIIPARGEAGPLVTVASENDLPRTPLTVEEIASQAEETEAQSGDNVENSTKPGLFAWLTMNTSENTLEEPTLEIADPALIATVMELSQRLPPGTQIVYQEIHGLSWADPQGWQVFIGRDINQFDAKFELYQKVISFLTDQGIQPVMVSVEQLNAPFYRLEQ